MAGGAVVARLQKQYSDYSAWLFRDCYVNDQFVQVHILQDDNNPDFVETFLMGYFKHSEEMFHEMHAVLEQPVVDFKKVRELAHKIRGSSASVGAFRVTETSKSFRGLAELQNVQGLKQCTRQAHNENKSLKEHLEVLFKIQKMIREAGGEVPTLNSNPPYPDPSAVQAQPDTGSGAVYTPNMAPALGTSNMPKSSPSS